MSKEVSKAPKEDEGVEKKDGGKALKAAQKKLIGGHIELGHVLGVGGFGKVYNAYDVKKKVHVAVKMIDKALVRSSGIQSYVEREIEMMRKMKNQHVVRLLEAIETSKAYNLVMELAPNGELFDKIVDSQRFDEETARNYFQQLICAVHYCHQMNIVHRDLKAENLLLGENNVLKVCDFGLSRYTKDGRFNDHEVLFTSLAGSIDYQAPEVLKERGYEGASCDMWSCGCVLFFMLCGYLPFTDRSDGLTRKRILSCQYNKTSRYLPEQAADLIAHLLVSLPSARYTTSDVIQHPWFRVNLDPSMFPNEKAEPTPMSPLSNGDFIQRSITPKVGTGSFGAAPSPTTSKAEEMHQAFQSCNVTGDGFLNKEEVRDALIKLNGCNQVTEQEVKDFMSNFQVDREGRITEEEFVMGWTKHQNDLGSKYDLSKMAHLFHYDLEKEFLQVVRKAFDLIDAEHSGIITKEKLKSLGLGLTDKDAESVFSSMDTEHKGLSSLTFEGFVGLCLKYDFFKNHPLAIRLRRLNAFFEATEHAAFRASLNTGYTVAGQREVIKALLLSKQETLSTAFEESDVNGFLYGTYTQDSKKVLEIGVRLLPAAAGYTKVIVYRIGGKTTEFHKWFLDLRRLMKDELLRCEEDTAVKGDPELM
ncbi:Protein tyrosine kinase/Protein kinase domain/RIO1 family/Kinase-like/EF-hand domain pair, putative [Leishmania lindenbergi]|uniref:non-specific serine/threonine protein kinase n=1 Tax=Leishmania lindenbergi TaxID=651832 RepID=A0AAW2ZZG2_9TRYP